MKARVHSGWTGFRDWNSTSFHQYIEKINESKEVYRSEDGAVQVYSIPKYSTLIIFERPRTEENKVYIYGDTKETIEKTVAELVKNSDKTGGLTYLL